MQYPKEGMRLLCKLKIRARFEDQDAEELLKFFRGPLVTFETFDAQDLTEEEQQEARMARAMNRCEVLVTIPPATAVLAHETAVGLGVRLRPLHFPKARAAANDPALRRMFVRAQQDSAIAASV